MQVEVTYIGDKGKHYTEAYDGVKDIAIKDGRLLGHCNEGEFGYNNHVWLSYEVIS